MTAVEFLEDKLMNHPYGGVYFPNNPKQLFEQAKEMEKKNTIAFGYRCIGEVDLELGDLIYKKVPEEIYNETFKSE